MNWLIDAQLPSRLVRLLRDRGEDALHTLDLPDGNRSADAALLAVAERDDRIIVTKDADFVTSFRLQGRPRRLLLVATGNIANPVLETLFLAALAISRPRSWLSMPDHQLRARVTGASVIGAPHFQRNAPSN